MRVGQPNPRNWRNVPRKPRYIWLLATRQLARKRQRSLMSLLITSPATVAAAATHLAGIGSALSTANAAAAAPTTALSVAGADEVSVLIAALFEAYAQEYQALSAQALAFHDQFVQALNMGAVCYAAAETANATPLQALQTVQQNVLTVVNAPTQALLGRPIIGNGANGLPNTGQDGGPGGLLFGNGGNGGSGGVDQAGGNGGAAGLIGNGGPAASAGRDSWQCGRGRAAPVGCCSATAGPAGPVGLAPPVTVGLAVPAVTPSVCLAAEVPAGWAASAAWAVSATAATRVNGGTAGLFGHGGAGRCRGHRQRRRRARWWRRQWPVHGQRWGRRCRRLRR